MTLEVQKTIELQKIVGVQPEKVTRISKRGIELLASREGIQETRGFLSIGDE